MKQHVFLGFALLVGMIGLQSCHPSFTPQSYEYTAIQSPLTNVKVEAEKIILTKGDEAKIVRLQNGSTLAIPEAAFVDENGKKVTGEVELSYRQFDNAVDIIASGIPMTYQDGQGKIQQLESGGIFELKGMVNGKPIFIAPDKSIKTSLVSAQSGDYDFYYLDPTEQEGKGLPQAYNWQKLTNKVDEIAGLKGVDSFELQYNSKFKELACLKGIQWQLAQTDAAFNPNGTDKNWVLDAKWDRLEISQPKFMIEDVVDVLVNKYKFGFPSPEDNGDLLFWKDKIDEVYNWRGELLETRQHRHQLSDDLWYYFAGREIQTAAGKVVKNFLRLSMR